MTLMNRMVDKGVLERTKPNTTCYYQASENKRSFLKSISQLKINKIINQYGQEIIPILQKTISKI